MKKKIALAAAAAATLVALVVALHQVNLLDLLKRLHGG
jgi:hypothetical protein